MLLHIWLGTAISPMWLWFDFGLLLCDFGLSSKYIKYLFGGSFCFGFSRELCRSSVTSLDLWCSFFALVWCGFFGIVCGNLTRENSPISLVFGLGIWYLFRTVHLNREYEFSIICYLWPLERYLCIWVLGFMRVPLHQLCNLSLL